MATTARRPMAGFTLVEVLVALLIMAVMAAMGWQGIDAMVRSRDISQKNSERTLRLATVIAQWEQDLQNLFDSRALPQAISFDGATVRLTRRAEGGVQIVAWSLQSGVWRRWASPPFTRASDLQDAWLRSQQLLGNEEGQVRLLEGVSACQVYFFIGNAWSNAQSTGQLAAAAAPPPAPPSPGASTPAAPAAPRALAPAGVRLTLELPGGALVRDVLIPPQAG